MNDYLAVQPAWPTGPRGAAHRGRRSLFALSKARALLDAAVQSYPENVLYRQAQTELNALCPPKP